jgi:Electron transfer DM13
MKIHRMIVPAVVLALSAMALLAQSGAILATGTFHGVVHKTSGRATVYQTTGGNVLRLTHFATSNGPNLHILLLAAADAKDDENFLTEKVERIDLGPLKGNEGDQNYAIPAGTDLVRYKSVAIFCERFNANFGTAPLEK